MVDLVLNDLRRPAGERFNARLELLILPFGIRNIRLYRFHGSWKNLHYVFFYCSREMGKAQLHLWAFWGGRLFPRPLLIFLDRHEMTVHVADMAEIQAIIREEKADGF